MEEPSKTELTVKETSTLKKVMISLIGIVVVSLLGFALYFIVTNIQNIIMLALLITGIILVGIVVVRISYLLFSFLVLLAGIVVFVSLIGWLTHWFG